MTFATETSGKNDAKMMDMAKRHPVEFVIRCFFAVVAVGTLVGSCQALFEQEPDEPQQVAMR